MRNKLLTAYFSLNNLLKRLNRKGTCGQVARSARACNVHHSKSDHFFIPINVIILEHGKASPNCNSFLPSIKPTFTISFILRISKIILWNINCGTHSEKSHPWTKTVTRAKRHRCIMYALSGINIWNFGPQDLRI